MSPTSSAASLPSPSPTALLAELEALYDQGLYLQARSARSRTPRSRRGPRPSTSGSSRAGCSGSSATLAQGGSTSSPRIPSRPTTSARASTTRAGSPIAGDRSRRSTSSLRRARAPRVRSRSAPRNAAPPPTSACSRRCSARSSATSRPPGRSLGAAEALDPGSAWLLGGARPGARARGPSRGRPRGGAGLALGAAALPRRRADRGRPPRPARPRRRGARAALRRGGAARVGGRGRAARGARPPPGRRRHRPERVPAGARAVARAQPLQLRVARRRARVRRVPLRRPRPRARARRVPPRQVLRADPRATRGGDLGRSATARRALGPPAPRHLRAGDAHLDRPALEAARRPPRGGGGDLLRRHPGRLRAALGRGARLLGPRVHRRLGDHDRADRPRRRLHPHHLRAGNGPPPGGRRLRPHPRHPARARSLEPGPLGVRARRALRAAGAVRPARDGDGPPRRAPPTRRPRAPRRARLRRALRGEPGARPPRPRRRGPRGRGARGARSRSPPRERRPGDPRRLRPEHRRPARLRRGRARTPPGRPAAAALEALLSPPARGSHDRAALLAALAHHPRREPLGWLAVVDEHARDARFRPEVEAQLRRILRVRPETARAYQVLGEPRLARRGPAPRARALPARLVRRRARRGARPGLLLLRPLRRSPGGGLAHLAPGWTASAAARQGRRSASRAARSVEPG